MDLSNLKNRLTNLRIGAAYSIDTDKSKGSEIHGYDELSIRWTENGIDKLIQIYPETKDLKIKKWKIWICASKDDENGRYWWTDTICQNTKKTEIVFKAKEKINEGIDKLGNISINDLKLIVQ
jgi:hypothetical protein